MEVLAGDYHPEPAGPASAVPAPCLRAGLHDSKHRLEGFVSRLMPSCNVSEWDTRPTERKKKLPSWVLEMPLQGSQNLICKNKYH